MHETRARTNRLRRSVNRPSQAAPRLLSPGDKSRQEPLQLHEQKTPVQTPGRSRLSASTESPHNESSSDLLQDIVWDTTSPSPQRLGKRGRRVAVVNISDIVSRIAPESGRPRVLEPALQQWIGDSATIPCTPELQPPKPKKKSPRPNGVDDLLRLAKQFDFNMLHEDLDPPGPVNPAPDPDWVSDEDLDYLFDGSTQSVSGAFSQSLPTPKTPKTLRPRETSHKTHDTSFSSATLQPVPPKAMDESAQKPSSNHNPGRTFLFKSLNGHKTVESFPDIAVPVQGVGADDDWGDDALMDDSLLMELTQNPPRSTSTQRNERTERARRTFTLTTDNGFYADLKVRQDFELEFSATEDESLQRFTNMSEASKPSQERSSSKAQNGDGSRRPETFSSSVGFQSNSATSKNSSSVSQSGGFSTNDARNYASAKENKASFGNGSSKEFGGRSRQSFEADVVQNGLKTKVGQSVSAANSFGIKVLSTNVTKSFGNTGSSKDSGPRWQRGVGSNSSSSSGFVAFPSFHAETGRRVAVEERESFPDGDLDSIFSSEPLWDDDDDLLCELCDDVETQMQSTANHTQGAGQRSGQTQGAGQRSGQTQGAGQRSGQTQGAGQRSGQTQGAGQRSGQTQGAGQRSGQTQGAGQRSGQTQGAGQRSVQTQGAGQRSVQTQGAGQRSGQTQGAGQRSGQTWSRSEAPPQRLLPGGGATDDFTFKRPDPVGPGPRGGGKCSAAEIELKKKQALERRRQRLQAHQPISSQRTAHQPISSQRTAHQPISSQRTAHQPISSLRAPT